MNNTPTFTSLNDAKYRNMRISLLLIVIASTVNLFSIILTETYFLFSAYITQLLALVGYSLYLETQMIVYPIVMGVIGLITVVPYLLCFIFSKKHVGWMIGALVIFSLDSLLFLPDFFAFLMQGDVSMILDLAIRIYALVSLAMGVSYGLKAKKETANAADAIPTMGDATVGVGADYVPSFDAQVSDVTREVTVTRKKSFVGCAMPIVIYVNGKEVCRLKNGETQTVTVGSNSFELGAKSTNGLCAGSTMVPTGTDALSYQAAIKTGMVANHIVLTRTDVAQ